MASRRMPASATPLSSAWRSSSWVACGSSPVAAGVMPVLTDWSSPHKPGALMATPRTPLRIAFLCYRGNPHSGGQGVYTRYLTRELVALGHDVTVFAGQPWPELDDGVQFVPVPSLNLYRRRFPFWWPWPWQLKTRIDWLEWGLASTGQFPEAHTFSHRVTRVLRRRRGDFDIVH